MAPDVDREEARVILIWLSCLRVGVAGKTSFLKRRFELVGVKYSDFIILYSSLDGESFKDE